jgi:hypothetical protein
VGVPELKGKVVLTCAHAVLPNFSYAGDSIGVMSRGYGTFLPMGNLLMRKIHQFVHFQASVENSVTHKKERFKFGDDDFVRLSITPESQKGQQAAEIPISDIYFLTGNDAAMHCYDIGVAILEKSVKCNGKIIPGLPLNRLNVMNDIRVADEFPHHLSWNGSSSEEPRTPYSHPTVIGYGRTGAPLKTLFPYLTQNVNESILGIGIKKAISLRGLDLRRRSVGESIQGCECADPSKYEYKLENNLRGPKALSDAFDARLRALETICKEIETYREANEENLERVAAYLTFRKNDLKAAKKDLEAAKKELQSARKQAENTPQLLSEIQANAKAMRSSYASSQATYGFSGSLIFKKGEYGNYDVFGIFSGPRFTDTIKTFIENAAFHQKELQEQE